MVASCRSPLSLPLTEQLLRVLNLSWAIRASGFVSRFPLLVGRLTKSKRVQLGRRAPAREMKADPERRISDIGESAVAPADPVTERVGRNGSAFFSREARKYPIGFRLD